MKAFLKTFAAAALTTLIVGCSSVPERAPIGELVWSTGDRPAWSFNYPKNESGSTLQFVGASRYTTTELSARDAAKRNAMVKASEYLGTLVETRANEMISSDAAADEIANEDISTLVRNEIRSLSVIKQATVTEQYVELFDREGERGFQAYALVEMPKNRVNTLVDALAKSVKNKINPKQHRPNPLLQQAQIAPQPASAETMQAFPAGAVPQANNLDAPVPTNWRVQ